MGSENLGHFAKLSAELRIEIWKYLRSCSGPLPRFESGALGVLRACQKLNDEATYYLYENERLHLHVGPVHGSWLQIGNDHGAVWTLEDATMLVRVSLLLFLIRV